MRFMGLLTMPVMVLFLASCVVPEPETPMTPLEIQALQSREYDSTKEIVFPSIVSVFQDLGYTITNADIRTGLISAESAAESDFTSKLLLDKTSVSQTKATAFVEQIGSRTRARLNFVEINRTSSSQGQTDRQDMPITDAKIYENAFDKIDNAIFVRSAN